MSQQAYHKRTQFIRSLRVMQYDSLCESFSMKFLPMYLQHRGDQKHRGSDCWRHIDIQLHCVIFGSSTYGQKSQTTGNNQTKDRKSETQPKLVGFHSSLSKSYSGNSNLEYLVVIFSHLSIVKHGTQ